jgi:hypothetical protein
MNGIPNHQIIYASQGYPISLMLYVIGMEVLTTAVAKAVQMNLFDGLVSHRMLVYPRTLNPCRQHGD